MGVGGVAVEGTGVVRKGDNMIPGTFCLIFCWATGNRCLKFVPILVPCSAALIALVFRLSSGETEPYQSPRDLEGFT